MRVAYQAFMGTNYGTILQTYALYRKLSEIAGIENVDIIGCSVFRHRQAPDENLKNTNYKKYLVQKMRKNFEVFSEKHMRFSDVLDNIRGDAVLSDEQTNELQSYSSFVCGSDQVWRPSKFWFCPKRYMTYANAYNTIGYAPSVVINKIKDIPSIYYEDWIAYLSKIKHISTREVGSSLMLENLLGRKCSYVVDPTLLMNSIEWLEFAHSSNLEIAQNYFLVYMLDYYDFYRDVINKIGNYFNLEPVLLVGREMGENPSLNSLMADTDPADFIKLLVNSKFVVCDGFHGCCLSIANNKPFFFFPRPDTKSMDLDNRIEDLLNRFCVCNRVYDKYKERSYKQILDLDWNSINGFVQAERTASLVFLKSSLNYGV